MFSMVSGDLGAHQNKKYNCEGHDIISKSPLGILIKINWRSGELGTRQCLKKVGRQQLCVRFFDSVAAAATRESGPFVAPKSIAQLWPYVGL